MVIPPAPPRSRLPTACTCPDAACGNRVVRKNDATATGPGTARRRCCRRTGTPARRTGTRASCGSTRGVDGPRHRVRVGGGAAGRAGPRGGTPAAANQGDQPARRGHPKLAGQAQPAVAAAAHPAAVIVTCTEQHRNQVPLLQRDRRAAGTRPAAGTPRTRGWRAQDPTRSSSSSSGRHPHQLGHDEPQPRPGEQRFPTAIRRYTHARRPAAPPAGRGRRTRWPGRSERRARRLPEFEQAEVARPLRRRPERPEPVGARLHAPGRTGWPRTRQGPRPPRTRQTQRSSAPDRATRLTAGSRPGRPPPVSAAARSHEEVGRANRFRVSPTRCESSRQSPHGGATPPVPSGRRERTSRRRYRESRADT